MAGRKKGTETAPRGDAMRGAISSEGVKVPSIWENGGPTGRVRESRS